jgi:acid phosphatase (class A)
MHAGSKISWLAGLACCVVVAMPVLADGQRPLCSNVYSFAGYVLPSAVDVIGLLPPSPAMDATAQQAELLGVLAVQRAAHAAGTTQRAIDDSEMNCARFKDVLGPELKTARAALKVVTEGAFAASSVTGPPKRYWKRARPYVVSKDVEALGDGAPGGDMADTEQDQPCDLYPAPRDAAEAAVIAARKTRERFEKDYTSYPSGHAAFGFACAALLSAIIPEQRAGLYARGRQYAESRVIIGVHFPADIEQGRVAGAIGMALLMQNASYQRLFQQARTELRAALHYPAALPELEPDKDFFKQVPPR